MEITEKITKEKLESLAVPASENILLGQRLKTLRKMRHLSQEAVSQYLGIMRCTYYHYESGRTVPPAKVLHSLAKFYEISPEMLLYPDGEENGNTDADSNRQTGFSDRELELVYYYRKLDERDRNDILLFTKLKSESGLK